MNCNMGKLDRTVRFIAGVAIIGIGLYFKSWWGLVGLLPIVTSIIGWCPAYVPLGISTCKTADKAQPPQAR